MPVHRRCCPSRGPLLLHVWIVLARHMEFMCLRMCLRMWLLVWVWWFSCTALSRGLMLRRLCSQAR